MWKVDGRKEFNSSVVSFSSFPFVHCGWEVLVVLVLLLAIRETERSLGLALRGDGGGLAGDLLGVAEVIVSDGLEIGVELIDEGNSCGDVEGDNLLVRDLIEILDQSPQTVSVGGDQNLLPGSNCGRNGLLCCRFSLKSF